MRAFDSDERRIVVVVVVSVLSCCCQDADVSWGEYHHFSRRRMTVVLIDVVDNVNVLFTSRMMAFNELVFISANGDGVEPGGQID